MPEANSTWQSRIDEGRRRLEAVGRIPNIPVDGGGGGGHPPGMDDLIRRVGRLETVLDQMAPTLARIDERLKAVATKEDVAKVEARVAKVEGAVEKLPTTLHLLGFIVSVLALAGIAKYLHL